ncbi:hypothetical protein D3C75_1073830 [compost metagenome]
MTSLERRDASLHTFGRCECFTERCWVISAITSVLILAFFGFMDRFRLQVGDLAAIAPESAPDCSQDNVLNTARQGDSEVLLQ